MSEIIERNVLKSLVSAYNEEKEKIEKTVLLFSQLDHSVISFSMTEYCIVSKSDSHNYSSIFNLMSSESLLKKLSQKYWEKAFEISKVKTVMPSKRIEEWDDVIKKGDLPEFNIENVYSTVFDFFSSKRKYMAEKADGILRSLSVNHKTNMSDQITEKFIFENVFDSKSKIINSRQSEKIDDLRSLIYQIQGKNSYERINSKNMLSSLYYGSTGEWFYVDGNSFRIKVFKKGTVHVELSPELVEELSVLLSELYPMQISNKKEIIKRKKEFKEYVMVNKMLSIETRDILSNKLKIYNNHMKRFNLINSVSNGLEISKEIDFMLNNAVSNFEIEGLSYKNISKELMDVFKQFGIKNNNLRHFHWFSADYNAIDLLQKIGFQGYVEDYKSHQFYPTKKELAEKLIEYASFETGEEKVLEPSAGQGGICKYIPVEKKNIDCVEISKNNRDILINKGYHIVGEEFINFSQKTKNRYDRIVMNPPFSKGRAKLHVEQAFKLLNEGGNIAAIIPATFIDQEIIKGAKHYYSEIFNDEFDDTHVSVVIVRIEK